MSSKSITTKKTARVSFGVGSSCMGLNKPATQIPLKSKYGILRIQHKFNITAKLILNASILLQFILLLINILQIYV